MTPLKIIEGILNKKKEINSLNNTCNDNDSSQNYRRNLYGRQLLNYLKISTQKSIFI